MLCDDNNTDHLQELIVSKFHEELQEGTDQEGVAVNENAMRNVLVGLGIAQTVHAVEAEPDAMLRDLKNGLFDLSKVLLCSTTDSRHVRRVSHVSNNQLFVIDPASGKEELLPDSDFKQQGISLLVCDHAFNVAPIARFDTSHKD